MSLKSIIGFYAIQLAILLVVATAIALHSGKQSALDATPFLALVIGIFAGIIAVCNKRSHP